MRIRIKKWKRSRRQKQTLELLNILPDSVSFLPSLEIIFHIDYFHLYIISGFPSRPNSHHKSISLYFVVFSPAGHSQTKVKIVHLCLFTLQVRKPLPYLIAFELLDGAGQQSVASHRHRDVGDLLWEPWYIYVLAASCEADSFVMHSRKVRK